MAGSKKALLGTTEDQFELGNGDQYGVRRVEGEMALFDPENGQKKVSELGGWHTGGTGWRRVANGVTKTIQADYTHMVDEIYFEDGGQIVLEDGGRMVLV